MDEDLKARWAELARESKPALTDEDFEKILTSPGLPLDKAKRRQLRDDLHRIAFMHPFEALAEQRHLVASSKARELEGIAKKAATLVKGLEDDHTLALVGDQLDEEREPQLAAPQRMSGFEEVENCLLAIRRLRDEALAAARMLRTLAATRAIDLASQKQQELPRHEGKRARLTSLLELSLAFQRAFGRPLGISREGPGSRFVREFFQAIRATLPLSYLTQLLRQVRHVRM